MGRFVLCLICLWCVGCTDDIGTVDFDETANEFSIFKPEIGTFNFKQTYERNENESPQLVTSFQVISDNTEQLQYDILAFKEATISFSNLAIVARGEIAVNDSIVEIDRNADLLLDAEKVMIGLIRVDTTTQEKSGFYEGVSKLVTPGEEVEDDTAELFSFFGSVDYTGRMLLFPTTTITSFDYIIGQYNENNEFSGKAIQNNTEVSDLSNQIQNFSLEDGNLSDVLFLTLDNAPKRIFLTIQKTDL